MFSPHKITAFKKLLIYTICILGAFSLVSVLTHIIFGTLGAAFIIGLDVFFFERRRRLRSKIRRERNREITSSSVNFDPQE
jgi:hypothetical protein